MNSTADIVPNITMSMKKGDTWVKTVKVSINGVEEELTTGDTIYFSVKENYDDEEYVLQAIEDSFTAEGYANILFTEEQTKTLTNKRYKYDCQWSRSSTNYVKTLFEGILLVNVNEVTEEGA